jgi:threonine dehydrogenase-like Zn-dependent dehydrogenase
MHALTFHGTKNICYESSNDPVLLEPGDAIVKISLAGICGSDLHVYLGRESGLDTGTVMGHEFVGEIIETGSAVKKFHKGNKVLSPFTTSCGECFYCRIGLTCRCEKGNLYGWVQQGKGLHGGQAEYVRVPMADTTLVPLSNDLNEEQGLLLGDVFSTGYYCADRAVIHPKGTYAVIGCGPVGLMAVVAAKHLGAENLYAVDTLPERLNQAQSFGALPLNANAINVKEYIFNITRGRGADAVLEAVGSPGSLRLAIELVRPGGIISSVGVHTSNQFAFSPIEAYDKNLTYLSGRCPARYYAEKLIREEVAQRYDITSIITHRFALQDGSRAYRVFDQKEDHCIKVVLLP